MLDRTGLPEFVVSSFPTAALPGCTEGSLSGDSVSMISWSRMMQITSARLFKKADNKAAGSAATEAYPLGTSQGDGRPRTQ